MELVNNKELLMKSLVIDQPNESVVEEGEVC